MTAGAGKLVFWNCVDNRHHDCSGVEVPIFKRMGQKRLRCSCQCHGNLTKVERKEQRLKDKIAFYRAAHGSKIAEIDDVTLIARYEAWNEANKYKNFNKRDSILDWLVGENGKP